MWLQVLNIPDSITSSRLYVCSDHFGEDDLVVTFGTEFRRRLSNTAVPALPDPGYVII